MAGLEKILSEINAQANTNAEEILGAARKEADAIRAEADKEASEEASRFKREAERRAEDTKKRTASAAALKKRQLLLAEKQKLIRGVLEKARTKLLSLPDAEYFDAIIKLVGKNALPQSGQICFNDKDLKRLPADFAGRIDKAAAGAGGKLSISRESCDIDGGFILIYDGIEQNCSVSAMFETNAEELSDEIQRLLF